MLSRVADSLYWMGRYLERAEATLRLVRALGSEGTPRDAPRLPTMARRDAMVASSTSGTWKGQISGSHYVGAARNALQRIGSPGSHGGIEWISNWLF